MLCGPPRFDLTPRRAKSPELSTSVAHPARVYDYWLGGKDNFAADREAAEAVIAVRPGILRDIRENRNFVIRAVRYLVLTQPASDVDAAAVAAGAQRYNSRVATPQTRRSRDEVTRFFDGLDLVEPGVVQPPRWRPDPDGPAPTGETSAWAGVARKP